MFTGLISDVGRVRAVEASGAAGDMRVVIGCAYDMEAVAIGASIACAGVCLSVVEKRERGFAADVSAETLSKTTLGSWAPGTRVNLERSLRLGDEMGGHIVSGHVDGVGEIVARRADGGSTRFEIAAPEALAPFIAAKGSIAADGTSLTVNDVAGARLGVNVIPHTAAVTTWGERRVGDQINLEIDALARYVARLEEHRRYGAHPS